MNFFSEPKPKVYLVGSMTGNYFVEVGKFASAALTLRNAGYKHVVNPLTIDTQNPSEELVSQLRELLNCTMIVLLPDWYKDKRNNLVISIASQLNFCIRNIDQLL
jgi:hypothetical protein